MIVTISQYRDLPLVDGRPVQIGSIPIGKNVYTAAGSSAAFNAQARVIRVATDTAIHLNHSCDGQAATTSDDFMPAGSVEYFIVRGGADVAFILA